MADRLANAAREPADCHQAVSVGSLAFGKMFWPTQGRFPTFARLSRGMHPPV